jgi:hypothetical protein
LGVPLAGSPIGATAPNLSAIVKRLFHGRSPLPPERPRFPGTQHPHSLVTNGTGWNPAIRLKGRVAKLPGGLLSAREGLWRSRRIAFVISPGVLTRWIAASPASWASLAPAVELKARGDTKCAA